MGLLSVIGGIAGNLIAPGIGGAIGSALGGAIGGSGSASAAEGAAGQTAAATDRATALQREMWLAQQEQQKPWLEAGKGALNKLIPLSDYTPFGMSQFQQDPGYAFRMSEGMKALERSAAARGGLMSGATMKGIQRYGQDLASQEYTNAFNRYQTERAARLQPLQSLANIGQTSANTLGAAGQAYGVNVGNALINQGYAAGNAGIAAANARNSMYGNIGSALGQVPSSQWSGLRSSIGNWFNSGSNGPGGSSWGMDLGRD